MTFSEMLGKIESSALSTISEKLTKRQAMILRGKLLGLRSVEIAFILGTSVRCVQRELKKSKGKLSF